MSVFLVIQSSWSDSEVVGVFPIIDWAKRFASKRRKQTDWGIHIEEWEFGAKNPSFKWFPPTLPLRSRAAWVKQRGD